MLLQTDSRATSSEPSIPARAGDAPVAYVLIGLPGSGKSTWAAKHLPEAAVACADTTLMRLAREQGVRYDEVLHQRSFAQALSEFQRTVAEAIILRKDVVLDQINHTRAARARKLDAIPPWYQRVAVYFPVTVEEAFERTQKREAAEGPGGRRVPASVILSIAEQLQAPEPSEFDAILVVPAKPAIQPAAMGL